MPDPYVIIRYRDLTNRMPANRFRPIISGATYFITSVTYQRRRWFDNHLLAQLVVDQLKYYQNHYKFDLHCHVVMPDHYHAVITPGGGKTIFQILHAVHSYTATLINQALGNTVKVKIWQGTAWDIVARDTDSSWRMCGYVLLNPWRAGLVKDPLQFYPFSNMADWRAREGDEFLLDLFAQIRDWREFGE